MTLGRNLGESIEVIDGVAAGDRLVVNPSDSLGEGDTVAVAANEDGGAASGAKAARPASKALP